MREARNKIVKNWETGLRALLVNLPVDGQRLLATKRVLQLRLCRAERSLV